MCLWRNSTYEFDTFAPSLLHPLAVIEIPIHSLAAYIIIFKTPSTMASVKWMMMLLHICSASMDLFLSILSTQYYLVPIAGGYMRGVLTNIGVSTNFQGHAFTIAMCVAGVSILGFFENRYSTVVGRNTDRIYKSKKRLFYILFHYVYSFTFTIPLYLNPPDQTESRKMVKEVLPCVPHYIIDHPDFHVFVEEPYKLAIHYGITSVVISIEVVYFFTRTAMYLSSNVAKSQKTYKLQVRFFIALTIQIAIPLFVVIVPNAYLITAFITNHYDQIGNNIAPNFMALHGLVSSTVMLIVHKPYREAVAKTFRLHYIFGKCFKNPANLVGDQRPEVVSTTVIQRVN